MTASGKRAGTRPAPQLVGPLQGEVAVLAGRAPLGLALHRRRDADPHLQRGVALLRQVANVLVVLLGGAFIRS